MDLLTKVVLVADDDAFARRVIRMALTRMGVEWVMEAADGKQALAALNERPIDIALLDVLMPEMHGLYLLHAIRSGLTSQDYSMPVMLLTATNDEASVHYAAGLSCDGFLLKPIKQTELADRLSKIITRRMALPYKPPHYRKIDVGPPDEPPSMPSARKTRLALGDLAVGMVLSTPVKSASRTIVPSGTKVTAELLTLLYKMDKVAPIEPMIIESAGTTA